MKSVIRMRNINRFLQVLLWASLASPVRAGNQPQGDRMVFEDTKSKAETGDASAQFALGT